ncbi:MAG: hypothetical protein KKE76_10790 [Gammaproteobacteria bacterium]|nr:hypothetical protein [Gammaproteobacteria bacterium]
MEDFRSFTLTLTPGRLIDFYRQLRQRARDPAQALQQLTALQALIGIGDDNRDQPACRQARQDLEEQLEQVREELLIWHAQRLIAALQNQDSAAIVRCFHALSRSGFSACVNRSWQHLAPAARDCCILWVDNWCRAAQQRATAAGRYPDAPDFRAADVDLETYLALTDLSSILSNGAAD